MYAIPVYLIAAILIAPMIRSLIDKITIESTSTFIDIQRAIAFDSSPNTSVSYTHLTMQTKLHV